MISCVLKKRSRLVYVLFMLLYVLNRPVSATDTQDESKPETTVLVNGNADASRVHENYKVFKFHFEAVSDPLTITLWILLGSLVKIGMSIS